MGFERSQYPGGTLDMEVFQLKEQPDHLNKAEQWYDGPGFYFWFCFPGCMPEGDGEAFGPYPTYSEALEAAREIVNE